MKNYIKCDGCGNAVDETFISLVFEGVFCKPCAQSMLPVALERDPEHGRIFTEELKGLVKFHVEHNEMESDNFQMAAYLGELVAVIDSKKFIKLKREIDAIVKKEITKRIAEGIEAKLDEYSHTRPPEDK